MAGIWQTKWRNPEFLVQRIDRCYLLAAGARIREKREVYLERARFYRRMLSRNAAGFAMI